MVPVIFVAPVWGIIFYNFGESGVCCGKSLDNPYGGNYSTVIVVVAAAAVCF